MEGNTTWHHVVSPWCTYENIPSTTTASKKKKPKSLGLLNLWTSTHISSLKNKVRGEEREFYPTQLRIQKRCCEHCLEQPQNTAVIHQPQAVWQSSVRAHTHCCEYIQLNLTQTSTLCVCVTSERKMSVQADAKPLQNIHYLCCEECQDKQNRRQTFYSPSRDGGGWTTCGNFCKLVMWVANSVSQQTLFIIWCLGVGCSCISRLLFCLRHNCYVLTWISRTTPGKIHPRKYTYLYSYPVRWNVNIKLPQLACLFSLA